MGGCARAPEVDVSAFVTSNLRQAEWFTIQVWIHWVDDEEEVKKRANSQGNDNKVGNQSGFVLPVGTIVTLKLQPHFLHSSAQEPHRDYLVKFVSWNGYPVSVNFPVFCPEGVAASFFETIEILVEEIPIGECCLHLNFENQSTSSFSSTFNRFSSAFASYAREDYAAVYGRLQMIESVVGWCPFLDIESIRCGENWREKIENAVAESDVFLLFWSKNAQKSEWVDREWKIALDRRGISYIKPFPLEPTLPPNELSSLQFSDKWSRLIHYEDLVRRNSGN
jgi:hypothetical protein